jgi:serine/threonine protein kinase
MRFLDYEVLFLLGEGGMANVYLAESRGRAGFRKLVVLKALKRSLAHDPAMKELFNEEARLSARLNHPNVVQVYRTFEHEGIPYMELEFLEGQPLSMLSREDSAPCPLVLRLHVLVETLTGLSYFHALKDTNGKPLNGVHRDISPQNVFLTYEGIVKVLDFGIAKSTLRASGVLTEAGALKGKLRYMAPEQLGGELVDGRADVFAVGVLLWEALARRRMWSGASDGEVIQALGNGALPELGDVDPDGNDALRAVMERALRPNLAERYATAEDMRAALLAAMEPLDPHDRAAGLRAFMQEHFAGKLAAQRERIAEALRDSERDEHTSDTTKMPLNLPTLHATTHSSSSTRVRLTSPGPKRRRLRRVVAGVVGVTLATASGVGVKRALMAGPRPESRAPAAIGAPDESERPSGTPCAIPSMLADFEAGLAEACAGPGRRGGVFMAYYDGTGTLDPVPGPCGKAVLLSPPRGKSRYALHFGAHGMTDWGAGLAVKLDEGAPVDLRAYAGIDLWLRATDPTPVTVSIAVPETLDSVYGGTCQSIGKAHCDDHFASERIVGSAWIRLQIPFSELRQEGWGVTATFDRSKSVELHLRVRAKPANRPPVHDFDLWIDDISLY